MKTFIFFCCLAAFSFTPKEILSQNAKIVIDTDKTVTVDEIFKIISDQTDYNFIYQEDLFKDFPKVQLKKGIIRANKLLEKSISNANIDFNFSDGNTIVIKQIKKVSQSTVGALQDIQISGIIKDDAYLPIAGATIMIKGTNHGTVSDFDGRYTITAKHDDVIVISYLGFKTIEVPVNGQTHINIELKADTQDLGEVVINAGYYSVKERESTGSIARVTAKNIEFQPVINPLQAIQGRVAGVDITQNTGVAGGGMSIEIRGRNFLDSSNSGRNNPMYIIDGVPFFSENLGKNNGNYATEILPNNISPLNAINPSDIISIEVLKDADATAIYGSRGANGVVLITTKKGNSNQMRFTVSSSTGFSKVSKFVEMMKTQQYLQMREEAYANSGITDYPVNAYDLNGTWEKDRYTNWQKKLIGDTAIDKSIALGISGGSQYTMFNTNLNHNESTTVFPTDKGYKRNSILLGLNHRSKDDRFKLNTATTYSTQSNNLPLIDLTQQAIKLAPNSPKLYDSNGNLNWQNGTFENPLAQLNEIYENKVNTLILSGNLSYNFISNTYFKINAGLTNNSFEEWKISPYTITNPIYGLTSDDSSSSKADQKLTAYLIEPQVEYNKTVGNHSFNVLLGTTYQTSTSNNSQIRGIGYSSESLIRNIGSAKQKYIGNTYNSTYKYVALFTRLNYNYDNKYILNLTARRDGSSRFAQNNRFGNFGAIGAAWLFLNEPIFFGNRWLSFGKLRGSYGTTGSDNIGDYAYLNTYSVVSTAYNSESGLTPTSLYNADYKWEKTTKFEAALEFGLFKDRINSTVAYYNNRSTDQLVGLTLGSTTGFSSILTNSPAVVENKGWEFTLNTQNISHKDWKWTTNFNISFPKNKLISYPGLEEGTQSSFYVIGEPLNIVKTYQYKEINPQTGFYEFTDFNSDGKINVQDRVFVQNLNPKFYGGIQNTLSYKNLTLDFLFYFKKQKNYNINRLYNLPGAAIVNLPIEMTQRWSIDNLDAPYIAANTNLPASSSNTQAFVDSDNSISDASYLRLKNLSISYVLKIPKTNIESLRIYLQGQNLWTITSYKGMDPEFTTYGYLPPLRTHAFGIQLTF